jgi:hypothetical protein
MLVLIITIEVFYLGSQSYSGVYFPVDQSGLALCGSAFAKTCKLRVLPFLFHPCMRNTRSLGRLHHPCIWLRHYFQLTLFVGVEFFPYYVSDHSLTIDYPQ